MNRQIVFKSRPVGIPGPENFLIKEAPEPAIQQRELLIKPKFIFILFFYVSGIRKHLNFGGIC